MGKTQEELEAEQRQIEANLEILNEPVEDEEEAKLKFKISVLTTIKNGGKITEADADEFFRITGEKISRNSIEKPVSREPIVPITNQTETIEQEIEFNEQYNIGGDNPKEYLLSGIYGKKQQLAIEWLKEDLLDRVKHQEVDDQGNKGATLGGVPGTCKTGTAYAISNWLMAQFPGKICFNEWTQAEFLGERNKVAQMIIDKFADLRKAAKTQFQIVVVNDAEYIFQTRTRPGVEAKERVLTIVEQLKNKDSYKNIYFILTTNRYPEIDEAIKSPARFGLYFEFDVPTEEEMKNIIKKYTSDIFTKDQMDWLKEMISPKWTGEDVKILAIAIRQYIRNKKDTNPDYVLDLPGIGTVLRRYETSKYDKEHAKDHAKKAKNPNQHRVNGKFAKKDA